MNIIISKVYFPFYTIIITASIFAGMIYIYKALKKDNYNDKNIFLYFLMYICFTIYFGKLYPLLNNPTKNPLSMGLYSYSGLFGVFLASIIYEKISPSNNKIIKYTILSLPLVYGIAKIACFIVGCCSGIPYKGIFSVTYKEYLNIPQFPIQIVETIVFIVIFIICNHKRNDKNIIIKTVIISITAKFLLDFLRYNHLKHIITTNQIISIIIVIITITYTLITRKKDNY